MRIAADWNRSNDTYLYGLVTGSPLAVPEQLPPVKNELFRAEIDLDLRAVPQPARRRAPTGSRTIKWRTSPWDRRR